MMKFLGNTKSKIIKDKNDENVPHLEINEVVLVHCRLSTMIIIIIQESWIYLLLINCLIKLLDISPKSLIFLKTFSSELSRIKLWFTDQNFKPIEIEDKINITLIIN